MLTMAETPRTRLFAEAKTLRGLSVKVVELLLREGVSFETDKSPLITTNTYSEAIGLESATLTVVEFLKTPVSSLLYETDPASHPGLDNETGLDIVANEITVEPSAVIVKSLLGSCSADTDEVFKDGYVHGDNSVSLVTIIKTPARLQAQKGYLLDNNKPPLVTFEIDRYNSSDSVKTRLLVARLAIRQANAFARKLLAQSK